MWQTPEKPIIKDKNTTPCQEKNQQKKLKRMLHGVAPSTSVTVSKLTAEEILSRYKKNEPSFTFCSDESESAKYRDSTDLMLFQNNSEVCEDIALLSTRVQHRFIGLETMSTCNVWFQASVPLTASARKRSRAKQRIGMSPGQRLSHLARRKQIFSRANLQRMADQDRKRVIEIKKNGIYQDKRSDASFHFEKLNTSKRALFMSPEDDLNQSGRVKEFPKRKLFGSSEKKKKVPLKENSKRSEVKRWLFQQSFKSTEAVSKKRLRDENYGDVPERKTKCPRRSLTFAEEDESSSRSPGTSSTYSSVSLPLLSQNHKNKLLWAVSVVLKEANLTRKDPNFKKCASSLFMTCRKNFNKILSYQMESTSDKILHFARQSIPSLLKKLGLENPNASREALTPVKQNHETNSKSNEGGKENLNDSDSSVVFKTPIKFLRVKKKSQTCDKLSNKIRFKGVLVRCKSLDSLADAATPEKKIVKKLFDCDNLNNSSFVHDESLDASILNDSDVDSSQILAPSSVTEESDGFSLFGALKKEEKIDGESVVDSEESDEIANQGFKGEGPTRIEESEDEDGGEKREMVEGPTRIEESEEEDLFEECENQFEGTTYSLTYDKLGDELEREKENDIFEDDDESEDLKGFDEKKEDFIEVDDKSKELSSINLNLAPEQLVEPKLEPEHSAETRFEQEQIAEPKLEPEHSAELELEPQHLAEPEPEHPAEPEVEPEHDQESETEVEKERILEEESETEPEQILEFKSAVGFILESEPETEFELEPELQLKQELEPKLALEANAEDKKQDISSGEKLDSKPVEEPELEELKPVIKPETEENLRQATELEQEPEPQANLEFELETEEKPVHDCSSEQEPAVKLEQVSELEREPTEAEIELPLKQNENTKCEDKLQAEPEPEPESEVEPESELESEAEPEPNASVICDDLMHLPETSTPKSPILKSKSRKLKVKKSKKNWKIVEEESDDDIPLANLRNLKLKVRLSHEWEVVSKNFSTDLDSTNFSAQQSRSQLEDESFRSSEIPDSSENEEQSTLNTFEKSGYLESESDIDVKEEPVEESVGGTFEKSGYFESESEVEIDVKEETENEEKSAGVTFEKSGYFESESEMDIKEEQVDESENVDQILEEKNCKGIDLIDTAEDESADTSIKQENIDEDNTENPSVDEESNNSSPDKQEKLLEEKNVVEIEPEPLVKIEKSPEYVESVSSESCPAEFQEENQQPCSSVVPGSDPRSTVDHAALKEIIKCEEPVRREENNYVTPGKRAGSPVLGSSHKKRVLSLQDYKARTQVEKTSVTNDLEGITPLNSDWEEEQPKKVYNIRLKHRHRHRRSKVSPDHKSRISEEMVQKEEESVSEDKSKKSDQSVQKEDISEKNSPNQDGDELWREEEKLQNAKMQTMFNALDAATSLLDHQMKESVQKHGLIKQEDIVKSLEAIAAINEAINNELEEWRKNPLYAESTKKWLLLLSKYYENGPIFKLKNGCDSKKPLEQSPPVIQQRLENETDRLVDREKVVQEQQTEESMRNKFDALLAASSLLDQQMNESVKKHGSVEEEDVRKSLEAIAAIYEDINKELGEWIKNPEKIESTRKWLLSLSDFYENSPMSKLKAEIDSKKIEEKLPEQEQKMVENEARAPVRQESPVVQEAPSRIAERLSKQEEKTVENEVKTPVRQESPVAHEAPRPVAGNRWLEEETPPRQVIRVQPQQRNKPVENVPRRGGVEQTPPSQIVHVAGNVPRWPEVEQTPPPVPFTRNERSENVSRWPVVEQTPPGHIAGNVPRRPAAQQTPPRQLEAVNLVKNERSEVRWPVVTPPRHHVENQPRWEMMEQTPPRQVAQIQPRQIVEKAPEHTPPKQVYQQYVIHTPPRQILEIHQPQIYRPYESTPPIPQPSSSVAAPQPVYIVPYVQNNSFQNEQTPPKQILHVPQSQPSQSYAPNLHKLAVERWHERNTSNKRPLLEGNPGFSNYNHPQKSNPRYTTTTAHVHKSYQNPGYFTSPQIRDREPNTSNSVQSHQSQSYYTSPPNRDRDPNPTSNSVQKSYQNPGYYTNPPNRDREANPASNSVQKSYEGSNYYTSRPKRDLEPNPGPNSVRKSYQGPNYYTSPPNRNREPNPTSIQSHPNPNYYTSPPNRDRQPSNPTNSVPNPNYYTTPPTRDREPRKILSGAPGFSNVNYPHRQNYHQNPPHYSEFHSPDRNNFQYYNQPTYHSPDNYAYLTTSTFHPISSNGHYSSYSPWNSPHSPHSLASGSNYHQQSPVVKPLRRSLVPQMHEGPYYGNC